jgi:hypothetical protein
MENITSGSAVVMSFDEILAYHLEYVITIPLPHEYVEDFIPVCKQALEAVNNHDIKKQIELPRGATCSWKDGRVTKLCPAYAIVYRYELQKWLNKEWF